MSNDTSRQRRRLPVEVNEKSNEKHIKRTETMDYTVAADGVKPFKIEFPERNLQTAIEKQESPSDRERWSLTKPPLGDEMPIVGHSSRFSYQCCPMFVFIDGHEE